MLWESRSFRILFHLLVCIILSSHAEEMWNYEMHLGAETSQLLSVNNDIDDSNFNLNLSHYKDNSNTAQPQSSGLDVDIDFISGSLRKDHCCHHFSFLTNPAQKIESHSISDSDIECHCLCYSQDTTQCDITSLTYSATSGSANPCIEFTRTPVVCDRCGNTLRSCRNYLAEHQTESRCLKNTVPKPQATVPTVQQAVASPTIEAEQVTETTGFSCKNHDGQSVDWFFAIKKAKSKEFVYVTSAQHTTWIHNEDITSDGPIKQTLQQAYNEIANLEASRRSELHAYNDHPPSAEAALTGCGHMKGVLMLSKDDDTIGFWMIHSVPKFPDFSEPEIVWNGVLEMGQSFFCATLAKMELKNVMKKLSIAVPKYYYSFGARPAGVPDNYASEKLANDMRLIVNRPNRNNDIYRHSHSTQQVKHFVQSYRLGTSPSLPSDSKVENVAFTDLPFGRMRFTRDNSKWSIDYASDIENDNKFVCIGDLNRVESHMNRGGCLLCMNNVNLWQLLVEAANIMPPAAHPEAGAANMMPPAAPPITCKNHEGNPVDWFIMIKKNVNKGSIATGYVYVHSGQLNDDSNWIDLITDNVVEQGPHAMTLRQKLEMDNIQPQPSFFAYNDQPPIGTTAGTKGHMKGVVMYGASTGFWLLHTVPEYINANATNIAGQWPQGANNGYNLRYGQAFVCITFDSNQANEIIRNIRISTPNAYHKTPKNIFNEQNSPSTDDYRAVLIELNGGAEFLHIAKSHKLNLDFYNLPSQLFGANLYVQTMRNGPHNPAVEDIHTKRFPFGSMKMKNTQDHSKWCITQTDEEERRYVCIGDLNRNSEQYKRGGGALCIENKRVWTLFKNAVLCKYNADRQRVPLPGHSVNECV